VNQFIDVLYPFRQMVIHQLMFFTKLLHGKILSFPNIVPLELFDIFGHFVYFLLLRNRVLNHAQEKNKCQKEGNQTQGAAASNPVIF
jgi:hypothetical protein